MSDEEQLRVDTDGLHLPDRYAEHEGGLVVRTPRSTIDHRSRSAGSACYGLVGPTDFRHAEDLIDPRNPKLAPDRVSLKRYGEEAETFRVVMP
ncbi:hypothetical protein [Haloparvum sedimenti]|uniref:hypothetical protein n=1 Tax=Haloparvum sedimenti TaxID=1678448 RepID=UPI00071E978E|nr:hypothetical protein [Haloparvum sedimenti]